MHNRKKQKTLDDLSVSKLLDDFIRFDALPSEQPTQDIGDEAYIKMMLRKQVQRKMERARRANIVQKGEKRLPTQKGTLDEAIRQRYFPYMDEGSTEMEMPVEDDIINEIMGALTANDISDLAAKMREAVDFVQEEMGESESERKLVEALERYRESAVSEMREIPHISNDNVLVLKRCQNCYFSMGERTRKGSVWVLCNNPDRTQEVDTDDSWVKNSINLPCWKQSEN